MKRPRIVEATAEDLKPTKGRTLPPGYQYVGRDRKGGNAQRRRLRQAARDLDRHLARNAPFAKALAARLLDEHARRPEE